MTDPYVQITAAQAGLTVSLMHGPSGARLRTVPPKDNGGDGSSFSPTDMLAGALLSCMLATMTLHAKRQGIPFQGAFGRVRKFMANAPRRVGRLEVDIEMPKSLTAEHRAALEQIARQCPVALTLSTDLAIEARFS